MTRQTTTPTERAQAAVDVLERRLKKLRSKKDDLAKETSTVNDEISTVEKRLAYAQQSPDLAQNTAAIDRGAVEKLSGGAAVAGESA